MDGDVGHECGRAKSRARKQVAHQQTTGVPVAIHKGVYATDEVRDVDSREHGIEVARREEVEQPVHERGNPRGIRGLFAAGQRDWVRAQGTGQRRRGKGDVVLPRAPAWLRYPQTHQRLEARRLVPQGQEVGRGTGRLLRGCQKVREHARLLARE